MDEPAKKYDDGIGLCGNETQHEDVAVTAGVALEDGLP